MLFINKYIVAIDDAEPIRALLRIAFETQGARFEAAATASGGLALCETKNPDLAILDLGLPDYEGFVILPRLKKCGKLRVIVASVRDEPESIERAIALGADAYITKPFNAEHLIKMVHMHLR